MTKRKRPSMMGLNILFIAICLSSQLLLAEHANDRRTIAVTGNAEVRVVPDEVILNLGIETFEKKLAEAKSKNNIKTQKVIDTAKKYGIQEQHIKTDYLNIEPRYENYRVQKDFKGFLVRKSIVLTLRDIKKFEDVLGAVLEVGANHVHGIKFRTTELRKFKDQARSLAIKAAKEKAVALAADLDQKIGKPIQINENRSGWWSGYNSWWGSSSYGNMMQNTVQNISSSQNPSSSGSFAPGQIKVNAIVAVTFELE